MDKYKSFVSGPSFVSYGVVHVGSLGWEDPLQQEMATHSSIPARRILWTEEPGGLQSMGLQRVGCDWATERSRTKLVESF